MEDLFPLDLRASMDQQEQTGHVWKIPLLEAVGHLEELPSSYVHESLEVL